MIDTKHRLYTQFYPQWELLRDVIEGDEATKKYVPKLDDQETKEYKAMVDRAVFENFTARTLDAITGLIFAKAPAVEVGTRLDPMLENIDLNNSTLIDLAQVATSEVCIGRAGLLVDMASIDTTGMTALEVEALNLRPYIKLYKSESIINWRESTINNVTVLTMVVLQESYDEWQNEFESKQMTRYRVYTLEDGVCRIRVYNNTKDGFVLASDVNPKMNGKYLSFIPFIPFTHESLTINPTKSPLYDLAKVNINYYQTSVDYAHGAHFTALPTAYASGVQLQQGESIKLGSSYANIFPDA